MSYGENYVFKRVYGKSQFVLTAKLEVKSI